jgi:DNA-binding MarR family transcriptional regulator
MEPATPASPRITYMVKQLELAARAEMDRIVSDFGVTALQYTALSVLARHPGMSGAQLARRSFVSAQAGSEMISALERKGLITRAPDESNRRILRVTLTAAGERLLADCDERMDRLEARMLSRLEPDDLPVFRRILSSCVLAITDGGRRSG